MCSTASTSVAGRRAEPVPLYPLLPRGPSGEVPRCHAAAMQAFWWGRERVNGLLRNRLPPAVFVVSAAFAGRSNCPWVPCIARGRNRYSASHRQAPRGAALSRNPLPLVNLCKGFLSLKCALQIEHGEVKLLSPVLLLTYNPEMIRAVRSPCPVLNRLEMGCLG